MTGKTNKSIAKRFKVTKSGKMLHGKPGYGHLRRKKSTKQKKAHRKGDLQLASGMAKRLKVLLLG